MNMLDRYAAAEKLLSVVAATKIRNTAPAVRWMKDCSAGWYQRETADGHEWVVVDPASGDRRLAFDHDQLAQALRDLGHEAVAT